MRVIVLLFVVALLAASEATPVLAQQSGKLYFAEDESGTVRLKIDGVEQGKTSDDGALVIDLTPGRHVLTAIGATGRRATLKLTFKTEDLRGPSEGGYWCVYLGRPPGSTKPFGQLAAVPPPLCESFRKMPG